jgi:hypothetical protein
MPACRCPIAAPTAIGAARPAIALKTRATVVLDDTGTLPTSGAGTTRRTSPSRSPRARPDATQPAGGMRLGPRVSRTCHIGQSVEETCREPQQFAFGGSERGSHRGSEPGIPPVHVLGEPFQARRRDLDDSLSPIDRIGSPAHEAIAFELGEHAGQRLRPRPLQVGEPARGERTGSMEMAEQAELGRAEPLGRPFDPQPASQANDGPA